MTFGPDHYVPVLKVKRGEKAALRHVAPHICSRVTPLLEIVERKADKAATIASHLDTAFRDLADSVRPYARCFLDVREIASDGPAAALETFQRAAAAGIAFTPVTGLSGRVDAVAAMSHRSKGVALRLTREEFENGSLAVAIRRFLGSQAIAPEDVDLIVDLGAVDELIPAGVRALIDQFLADVPDKTRWRTLTVSACAFPPSMGGVGRESHSLTERSDWLAWRDGLHARRAELARLPTYSDAAIQHPKGVEGFDPLTMQMSASVRYTVEESWLLIKGESTRRTPPSVQFPKLATHLVYGHLRSYYRGSDHCSGCSKIKGAADGVDKCGSAEVWRRLGTIHHITSVVEALRALSWP